MADEKIIFSMVGVSKTFTNQKKVLNNITLSFSASTQKLGLGGTGNGYSYPMLKTVTLGVNVTF